MKNIFSNVMLVAAAAMAFFSCQKQEIATPEISGEVMLSFVSEKPSFVDETKTEWTGETVQWSKGDKISIAYTVDGNWQNASGNADSNAKLYKSDELGQASQTAKFNVSTYFEGTTEGVHVFYGVYPAPSETGFAGAPVASISVAPSQAPKADSFDANGDLMVGISRECSSRPAEGEKISLLWDRLVAHAVITLKEINGLSADEVLEKVTLTAQDGANLVGKQKLNIITKEIVCDNASSNVLTIGTGNLTQQNGSVTFWACVLPETITSLNVAVETDKAVYTREITGISKEFMQNARNLLTINMSSAERVLKVVDESSVVDVLTRATTGATTTSYISWSGKTLTSSAVYAGQSAGGNESVQLRSSNNNSGVVTTASGGYAKKVSVIWNSNTSNGRTLNVYGKSSAYNTPSDLYDQGSSGTLLGTIVCGTSTELIIEGEYEYIGMRSASGAMYLEEIKITWSAGEIETPEDYLTVSETEINVNADATTASFTVSSNLEWTATSDDAEVAVNGNEVNVKFEANTTDIEHLYTVVISANGVESKTVTITQAAGGESDGVRRVTVKEFKNLTGSESATYELSGVVSKIYDPFSSQYQNISFYIEDETGDVLIFRMSCEAELGNSIRVGDQITVQGKPTLYSNSIQMAQGGACVNYVAAPYVEFEEEAVIVDANIQTFTLKISSNTNWTLSASEGISLGETSGTGDKEVVITFPANETSEIVSYTLTLSSDKSTAIFVLTQNAKSTGNEPETEYATLSFANKAQRTSFSTTMQVWEQNGIKLVNEKSSSTSNVADYANPARFYKSSKITVEAPGNITKIEFTCNNGSYATALKSSIQASLGAISVSGNVVTIIPNDSATTFVVSSLTGGQVRMNSLTVTYEK